MRGPAQLHGIMISARIWLSFTDSGRITGWGTRQPYRESDLKYRLKIMAPGINGPLDAIRSVEWLQPSFFHQFIFPAKYHHSLENATKPGAPLLYDWPPSTSHPEPTRHNSQPTIVSSDGISELDRSCMHAWVRACKRNIDADGPVYLILAREEQTVYAQWQWELRGG